MKTVWLVAAIIAVMYFMAGCTTQNVYDSIRYNRELDCQKMQGLGRDDCMSRLGMSYEEYQRQLKSQKQ
jgi:hypothetical protein